jgi:molecular chaperone HtpG
MTNWSRRIPFQVDIAGIIEIMGSSLYSRVDTPIRELIQNAHDAIMRRRASDIAFRGRIDIHTNPEEHSLQFSDDGVGLSPEDAERYLSTLGVGVTGLLKRGSDLPTDADRADGANLIGQFGIGLFSAFMLADRMVVESRRDDASEGVRWEAGAGTEIEISGIDREQSGTTVTLFLKPAYHHLADQEEPIVKAVKEFADFLTVPVHLNGAAARLNVINVAWFDPTPDKEAIELAMQEYFDEAPLDVLPIHVEKPASITGALYVTPQRTPGFADDSVVTVTIRRMVISQRIQGLLPVWGTFFRGVLEVENCSPTASREDLVRNEAFKQVRSTLEEILYKHCETIAATDPVRWESLLTWHRYTFAGAALNDRRLREILRKTYKLPTSQGQLTIDQILERSPADPLTEPEAERVVWYNTDRRQERWVNELFSNHDSPCVHTLRSFEESLIATIIADDNASGTITDLRYSTSSAPNFAQTILSMSDLEDAPDEWQRFFESTGAQIQCASFAPSQPVMAFLNERYELAQTFEELKKEGTIPSGFERLIDRHFENAPTGRNEIVLNRDHRLVSRAFSQGDRSPLASVLRLLVLNALNSAGASVPQEARRHQSDDLDWIAEALWGRD